MGLKEIRERKNYTRRELSEMTGINFRSLQDYEQGHKSVLSMKSDSLYRLSLALDCTMEDILSDYYVELEMNPKDDENGLDEQMRRLLAYRKALEELKRKK